jgi:HAMP domain-containing protein
VAFSMATVVGLITEFLFGTAVAVGIGIGAWFAWFWYGLPLSRRLEQELVTERLRTEGGRRRAFPRPS